MRSETLGFCVFLFGSVTAIACGCVTRATSGVAGGSSPALDSGWTDDPPATCDAPLPDDVQIPALDLQGYPPYAGDGCTLVYVAGSGTSAGDLRSRDLKTGAESILAPASESPRRPSIAGSVIAWEAKSGARSVVRVRVNGATTTLSGDFDHAGEPRATSDAVVFTGWHGEGELSDTDVFLYDVSTTAAEIVLGGAGQQRFPDVSRGIVGAADFSEDPDGTFDRNETDLADLVIYDRNSGAVTHRTRPGKQAFPIVVSPTRIAYLDWGEVHPEPKLTQYALRIGDITGTALGDITVSLVKNAGPYVLPAGRNGVLEWIDASDGTATLWRVPADLTRSPALVPGLGGLDLFAPASTASFTVLGTRSLNVAGGAIILRGVAR